MLPDIQSRILDLNARYAQAIDDDRLEEWPGFFTESARYVVTEHAFGVLLEAGQAITLSSEHTE